MILQKIKKWHFIILIGTLVAILAIGFWQQKHSSLNQNVDSNRNNSFIKAQFNPETTTTAEETPAANLPTSFLIADFPFQTQAPLTNWDALHEEACEEASITLVDYYLKNQGLSAETMNTQILKLVDWQEKNWGGHFDLTAAQTLSLAENFYGLKGQVISNATIADLKKEIAAGHPVIVPTAGRLLGNPNFSGAGPVYHMVVAIGYDKNNIIVQDVGTRNGEHYIYNQKIFYNAMHDWPGSPDNIADGGKNVLILTK
jgi:hypothetical protein